MPGCRESCAIMFACFLHEPESPALEHSIALQMTRCFAKLQIDACYLAHELSASCAGGNVNHHRQEFLPNDAAGQNDTTSTSYRPVTCSVLWCKFPSPWDPLHTHDKYLHKMTRTPTNLHNMGEC